MSSLEKLVVKFPPPWVDGRISEWVGSLICFFVRYRFFFSSPTKQQLDFGVSIDGFSTLATRLSSHKSAQFSELYFDSLTLFDPTRWSAWGTRNRKESRPSVWAIHSTAAKVWTTFEKHPTRANLKEPAMTAEGSGQISFSFFFISPNRWWVT